MMARRISSTAADGESTPNVEMPIQPSSIIEAEDPAGYKDIDLNYGEVLLVSIDENGKEIGTPFKVSNKTYSRYFNNQKKFRLKKK